MYMYIQTNFLSNEICLLDPIKFGYCLDKYCSIYCKFFFSCFPWLCYIRICFNVLIHFSSATALSWMKKKSTLQLFSNVLYHWRKKNLRQFSQSYHNVHFRTYGGYLYWDAFLWHFKNCSVLVCTFFAA